MKKGDKIGFRVQGREQWVLGEVLLVSSNQKSIGLVLEHLADGLELHAVHPEHGPVVMLLLDDASLAYRDLATGVVCELMVTVQ